jgi:hypothetical protein
MARLALLSSSFIRTITVGSGIAPDLLTLSHQKKALAGSACWCADHTAGGELHPALKT